jgi:hypothetical protein
VRSCVRELWYLLGVFFLWQIEVAVATTRYTGAYPAGRFIWHAERVLHLPNEAAVQRLALPHRGLLVASYGFYEYAFWVVPPVVGFVLWRTDRAAYLRARTLLVVAAVLAFLVAWLLPVAPPRLLGRTVDVGVQLGMSEYRTRGVDVLSALPSVHIVFAVVVAVALASVGVRWLGIGYVAVTVAVVVITGNHTWIDCAAGVLDVLVAAQLVRVPAACSRSVPVGCDLVVADAR